MRDVDVASCDGRTAGPPAQWLDDRFEHGLKEVKGRAFLRRSVPSKRPRRVSTLRGGVSAVCSARGFFVGSHLGHSKKRLQSGRLGGERRDRTSAVTPGERACVLGITNAKAAESGKSGFATSPVWSPAPSPEAHGASHVAFWRNLPWKDITAAE